MAVEKIYEGRYKQTFQLEPPKPPTPPEPPIEPPPPKPPIEVNYESV
jgi:hypothetical protein